MNGSYLSKGILDADCAVIDSGLTISEGMVSLVYLEVQFVGAPAEKAKTPRPEGGGCGRARHIGTRPT
jgi:hypothetical protein